MQPTLQLDIVTPDRTVISQSVEYVGLPGMEGQLGIMPQHVPLLTALHIGDLYFRADGKTVYVFVSGGFAEISDNRVTVLAEAAELANDIDVTRAQQAKERAEARLILLDEELDEQRAHAALTRAVMRLRVADQG